MNAELYHKVNKQWFNRIDGYFYIANLERHCFNGNWGIVGYEGKLCRK